MKVSLVRAAQFIILAIIAVVVFGALKERKVAKVISCMPADLSVKDLRWQNDPSVESVRVTGSLYNGCANPAHATVQFIYLDDKNVVVSSSNELWPAGTTNIPAQTQRQFLWQEHLIGNVAKVDYRIMRVWE